ncbi:hypothetical protein M885DRAFT_538294 [Pelagophyceae sp. CCMP2097]|nr:hypothetical protein M885DRAFT_538294 [Pelagophyceae sp. CCMP2097]
MSTIFEESSATAPARPARTSEALSTASSSRQYEQPECVIDITKPSSTACSTASCFDRGPEGHVPYTAASATSLSKVVREGGLAPVATASSAAAAKGASSAGEASSDAAAAPLSTSMASVPSSSAASPQAETRTATTFRAKNASTCFFFSSSSRMLTSSASSCDVAAGASASDAASITRCERVQRRRAHRQ